MTTERSSDKLSPAGRPRWRGYGHARTRSDLCSSEGLRCQLHVEKLQ